MCNDPKKSAATTAGVSVISVLNSAIQVFWYSLAEKL